ncbi:MAG: ChbG/HpnK family deacetylase [Acidobacteriota bacterium]
MKLLIVNADDFGRTAGVNAGTLQAHADGVVTSATVMVLEPHAESGFRDAAQRAPSLSLGLHFVLTGGGRPAAAPADLPTLAPRGLFRRSREELPRRIPHEEIRAELEAQLGLFQILARKPPTHLDSHHHVALHGSVAPVFAEVARERSLPARASNRQARKMLRAAGVRTPDDFIDRFYADGVRFETLQEILSGLREGISELMCHPGFADAELRKGSSYAQEREREIAVLGDPRVREIVRARNIRLVGFEALPNG